MKIKRYVVKEMQEAIKLIKQDLGPEAVIVSSYRVQAKGFTGLFAPRMLEVTAALDEPQEIQRRVRKTSLRLAAVSGGKANREQAGATGFSPEDVLGDDSRLYLAEGADNSLHRETAAALIRSATSESVTSAMSAMAAREPVTAATMPVTATSEPVTVAASMGTEAVTTGAMAPAAVAPAVGATAATSAIGVAAESPLPIKPHLVESRPADTSDTEENSKEAPYAFGRDFSTHPRPALVVSSMAEEGLGDGAYSLARGDVYAKTAYTDSYPAEEDLPVIGKTSLFELMVNKELARVDDGLNWHKALLEADVDESIVEVLLAGNQSLRPISFEKPENAFRSIKKRVVELMAPAYRSKQEARIMVFVGPAGMGKTTTLAKLATLKRLNEQKKVAMITVQNFRLCPSEQLRVYGDYLEIPMDTVMTPAELSRAVEKHRDKDCILIDTSGRSARNSGNLLELKSFINVIDEPKETFLVLSLATKNRDLHRTVREFLRVGCSKMIFTKLDETDTYGSLLNMVVAHGLPVAYVADGMDIPDCISEAGPRGIAELLLRKIEPIS